MVTRRKRPTFRTALQLLANNRNTLTGIGFALLMALLGRLLAQIPLLGHIGPLACAIALAVLYRHWFGYPEAWRTGLQFCSRNLLRIAIVLLGLRLDIQLIVDQGAGLLLRATLVIALAVALTVWLGRRFSADPTITLLLGIGTGICGAAAIAATSPILRAREEDTALATGLIALTGTLFAITYPLIQLGLGMNEHLYGLWTGISLHEIAHVAMAAQPAGEDAMSAALLAKLSRVLLLVPFCFLLMGWLRWREKNQDKTSQTRPEFPWFLLGFVGMSVLGSYVFGNMIKIPDSWIDGATSFSSLALAMALVAFGLNVNLAQLRTKAWRPLVAMCLTSIVISVLGYWLLA